MRTAVNDCQRFEVKSLDDWRLDSDQQLELLVQWRGFQEEDKTWEAVAVLLEDVPVLVRGFLASGPRRGE